MRIETAFSVLRAHRSAVAAQSTAARFLADPARAGRLSLEACGLYYDFSKQRIDEATMPLLLDLARAAGVEARRAALFAGAHVNVTEDRPALHMALRRLSREPWVVDGQDVMPDVRAERAKVAAFATGVREGAIRTATGEAFTDIVNIGIGGSDLGPAMAARALAPFGKPGLRAHFVSNVDGADLGDTISGLDPARTLFIVSSKTFTTQETMTNAASARAFIADALGEAAVRHHFAAVSTRLDKVAAFGIAQDRVFGFKDWVGGRYSIWSSIGLALVIAIGPAHFEAFLRGGEEIDRHFVEAPLERNLPVLMALIGVWNRNILDCGALAVIPYDQRLGRFCAYLQQLEMESNGKTATLSGGPAPEQTAPVIWGEPGTNGQHAFFQMLHQGTQIVPIDFLVAATPTQADDAHHQLLMANCFAQGEALMRGRSLEEVETRLAEQGTPAAAIDALAPHKVFSGDRPTSTLLYHRLDPAMLGRLIALYEHKVFVQGVIWDVNSFDQWGVELGKELASRLAPIVCDPTQSLAGLDASTAGLIARMRAFRRE